MENTDQIAVFEQKQIRRVEHEGELWFSIVDVIWILTDSPSPKTYWAKLKKKLFVEGGQEFRNWEQLKMTANDGKKYKTDAANTQSLFRIIQSVSSPKAEPFKLWLAQVGTEHIAEIQDPELAAQRAAEYYRLKGYPPEWIERRMQSIETRKSLTAEWKNRGVKEGQEYAILTAEIAKATFGVTPNEHAKLKNLERQNLRDHMTPLELIFTALGEEATRQITIQDDAQGFQDNQEAAQRGGRMAGNARIVFEKTDRVKVVSTENFLGLKGEDRKGLTEPDGKSE